MGILCHLLHLSRVVSLRVPFLDLFNFIISLYHCYADDTQLYLPLKRHDANSLAPLLDRLDEVTAWMASDFLKFNEEKTEVMIFRPGNTCDPPDLDLSVIKPYVKPNVKNLGVIMHSDFKLDKLVFFPVEAIIQSQVFFVFL